MDISNFLASVKQMSNNFSVVQKRGSSTITLKDPESFGAWREVIPEAPHIEEVVLRGPQVRKEVTMQIKDPKMLLEENLLLVRCEESHVDNALLEEIKKRKKYKKYMMVEKLQTMMKPLCISVHPSALKSITFRIR